MAATMMLLLLLEARTRCLQILPNRPRVSATACASYAGPSPGYWDSLGLFFRTSQNRRCGAWCVPYGHACKRAPGSASARSSTKSVPDFCRDNDHDNALALPLSPKNNSSSSSDDDDRNVYRRGFFISMYTSKNNIYIPCLTPCILASIVLFGLSHSLNQLFAFFATLLRCKDHA